ncbi:MAG: ABC transporter ATP-binding protein [Clostridiales bacterium]|nr:ABC transporter ATP-binding protein [Clostridiales bacterium]
MALEKEIIIEARDIRKYFFLGKDRITKEEQYLHAVDHVSLTIHRGEIYGVVGESGSGKSTLGRCLLKLLDIDDGVITFKGQRIDDIPTRKLMNLRKNMQMVFQNPFSSFNPRQRLGDAVMEIANVHIRDKTRREKRERLEELLEQVNLPKNIINRYPRELSGGQLQRFAILRALYLNPEFIIADEAVSALDVSVQAQILNLLMDLRDNLDLTILFISHELTVVEHVCDKVLVLYLGAVMENAPADKLFSNVLHPYSLALLASKPKEHPAEADSRLVLEGTASGAVNVPQGCRFCERCFKVKRGVCDQITPELREAEPEHFVACHFPLTEEERRKVYELI